MWSEPGGGGAGGAQMWTELTLGLQSRGTGLSGLVDGGQEARAGLHPWRRLAENTRMLAVPLPQPVLRSFPLPGMSFPGGGLGQGFLPKPRTGHKK